MPRRAARSADRCLWSRRIVVCAGTAVGPSADESLVGIVRRCRASARPGRAHQISRACSVRCPEPGHLVRVPSDAGLGGTEPFLPFSAAGVTGTVTRIARELDSIAYAVVVRPA